MAFPRYLIFWHVLFLHSITFFLSKRFSSFRFVNCCFHCSTFVVLSIRAAFSRRLLLRRVCSSTSHFLALARLQQRKRRTSFNVVSFPYLRKQCTIKATKFSSQSRSPEKLYNHLKCRIKVFCEEIASEQFYHVMTYKVNNFELVIFQVSSWPTDNPT